MSSDVDKLLGTLAVVKPSQEMFVRAVLHEVLPEQDRAHGERCSELVVDEVFASVANWLPADQHTTFKFRLKSHAHTSPAPRSKSPAPPFTIDIETSLVALNHNTKAHQNQFNCIDSR
ncbi:hypothetical protein LZ31DRAFT_561544 [Colletotrichum somersetense]|nr:hypothetical protein LZ31DRAFT_561544 [Colletotrichum somersetense]